MITEHEKNRIVYSNETETLIIRVADIIPLVESKTGLPLLKLAPSWNKVDINFRFEEMEPKPDAAWWFFAQYNAPDGIREGDVLVYLQGSTLVVASYDVPRLIRINEAQRHEAKQNIPGLTLEYIEQLEYIARMGWQMWKNQYELAKTDIALRSDVRIFEREYRKVGYLLPDHNTDAKFKDDTTGPDLRQG